MLAEVSPDATHVQLRELASAIACHEDLTSWPVRLANRCFIAVAGDERLAGRPDSDLILAWHSTADRGYWLVDKANSLVDSPVRVGNGEVGGTELWCAAGPCAVESIQDTVETALLVRDQGVDALRASLFKARTSPYHFPGKQRDGLSALQEVRAASGLPVVTEVIDPRDVASVAEVADCLQVDPRNMTNRALLTELGHTERPVLLMRGLRSTVDDWLKAAEYIVSRGNPSVIMCARGIVSFDRSLAFQPDYGAITAVRRQTGLPVIFDPSHSTGRTSAVAPAALAAVIFGVDGLLIESHIRPEQMHQPGDAAQMYPGHRLGELLQGCRDVRRIAARVMMTDAG